MCEDTDRREQQQHHQLARQRRLMPREMQWIGRKEQGEQCARLFSVVSSRKNTSFFRSPSAFLSSVGCPRWWVPSEVQSAQGIPWTAPRGSSERDAMKWEWRRETRGCHLPGGERVASGHLAQGCGDHRDMNNVVLKAGAAASHFCTHIKSPRAQLMSSCEAHFISGLPLTNSIPSSLLTCSILFSPVHNCTILTIGTDSRSLTHDTQRERIDSLPRLHASFALSL